MKSRFESALAGAFLLGLAGYHPSALANIVPYIVTGTFDFGFSEASDFDGNFVDSFADVEPIVYPAPFTLLFDLDTSADGDVIGGFVTGGIPVRFDNAVSNISLSINGVNVINDTETSATVTQFDRFDGAVPEFPSRWDFSLSPTETTPWNLDPVTVFTQDPLDEFAFIGTDLTADFLSFGLFDNTGELYDGFSFTNELLLPNLSLFDSTSLRIFWEVVIEDDCFDEECGTLTDVFYTAFATVESVSVVPLPAAVWLFGAGVAALGAVQRRAGMNQG